MENRVRQQIMSGLGDAYDRLTNKYPAAKFIADLLPGTGQVTSALDSANDFSKGNYGASALDLAGLIPGVKQIKALGAVKKGTKYAGRAWKVGRGIDALGDYSDYEGRVKGQKKAKGGKVKKMANGGSASRRADGCATKGKTKGRFV